MSLFKTKEWWRTKCGTNEIFCNQNLLVAPLLGLNKKNVIIIGSNKGFLRIYNPLSRPMETELPLSYSSKDLIIETQLTDSIVDLKTGRFIFGSQNYCLAVLMPERLLIYNLQFTEGSIELGDKCSLEVECEHQLPSLAMSLTVGPFGGVNGTDFICVQFYDGRLLFLERELHSSIRILKNRLQHEPLVYLKTNDVFVTQNADWALAFYKYQTIAEPGKGLDIESESTKLIEPDWIYNLGEAVLAINSVTLSTIETGIVVITERNLYCFHETHLTLKFSKRLAYNAICIETYIIEPDGKLLSIVVTDSKTMMVYEGSSLKWSAEVPFIPIAVKMAHSQEINGLLVILSEEGHLEVCFLGSQPSLYMAPSIYRRRYNYEQAESELLNLRSLMRKRVNNDEQIDRNVLPDFELQITADIDWNSNATNEKFVEKTIDNEEEEHITFICTIKLQSSTFLSNIQMYVEMFDPWEVCNDNCSFLNLCGEYNFQTLIRLKKGSSILSSELDIIVTYENDQGNTHVVQKSFPLDMKLLFKSCPPEEKGPLSIAVRSNEFVSSIFSLLFNDFVSVYSQDRISNSLSLQQIQQKQVVTVDFDLPKNQIRVHASDELAMFLVLKNIINKLPNKITKSLFLDIEQDKLYFIFDYMKSYSNINQKIKTIKNEITLLSSQLRNIIRKIIHIREKNFQLASDTGLLCLLKITCQKMFILVENFVDCSMKRLKAAHNLNCVLQLILDSLRISIPEDTWKKLESAVGFQLQSEHEMMWEHVTKYAFDAMFRENLKHVENEFGFLSSEKFDTYQDTEKLGKCFLHIIQQNIISEDKKALTNLSIS